MRASHILVATENEATRILDDLKSNRISFEEAARSFSTCPSRKQGGDLGGFNKGEMVKPFEDACAKLNNGQISEPVKTQFGWHLILRTG